MITFYNDRYNNKNEYSQNKIIHNFLNYLFGKTNFKDYKIECDIKIQEKFQKQINEIILFY